MSYPNFNSPEPSFVRKGSLDDAPDDAPGAHSAAAALASAPPAVPAPFDHGAALRRYLALLDDSIEWCFDRDRYDRGVSGVMGARLVRTSMEVMTALKEAPERRFTYRMVVEHAGPPRLADENLKTIHGVAHAVEPQAVGRQQERQD